MAGTYTDAQLRAELVKLGENPGPVTDSTRSLYLKKLQKLKDGGGGAQAKKAARPASKSPGRKTKTAAEEPEKPPPPPAEPASATRRTATRSRKMEPAGSDSEDAVAEQRRSRSRSGGRQASPVKRRASPKKAPLPPSPVIPGERNIPSRQDSSVNGSPGSGGGGGLTRSILGGISRAWSGGGSPPSGEQKSAFAYSDSSDDSPERADKSANTSFLPPSASVIHRRPPARRPLPTTPPARSYGRLSMPASAPSAGVGVSEPKRRSPVQEVFENLNKWRKETYESLKRRFPAAGGTPPVSSRSRMMTRSRAGAGSHYHVSFESRSARSWCLHLPDNASRYILGALFLFLLLLSLGYVGAVHREKVVFALRVVEGAAKDTASFVYSNMILPVLLICFVGGLVLSVWWLAKVKRERTAAEKRQVYRMVDDIIQILKRHAETETKRGRTGTKQESVAVPSIHDMLISPASREKLEAVWEKAVAYINENESRVVCEQKSAAGQDFLMWRWVQPYEGTSLAHEEKVWQGHVFESKEEIRRNVPRKAYSNALKIRGMFDPDLESGEEWTGHIQDAILEKLGEKIRVMHMAVDKPSKEGCVYMLCATPEEAGEALAKLHGSWFNGRLISVKYLRTERYEERFPDCKRAAYPLEVSKPRHSLEKNW